jgi:hypothetical protein
MQNMKPKKFVERTNKHDTRKIIKTPAGTVIPKFKPRADVASAWLFNKVKK